MNWSEMIQARRRKEEMYFYPFGLAARVNHVRQKLEESIFSLSCLEQRAINLRFLSSLPIARVADAMGMSWDGAEELIDRAVVRIEAELGI
jgi:DNA-directed RNA polymerase specialized sigma24 family protein